MTCDLGGQTLFLVGLEYVLAVELYPTLVAGIGSKEKTERGEQNLMLINDLNYDLY